MKRNLSASTSGHFHTLSEPADGSQSITEQSGPICNRVRARVPRLMRAAAIRQLVVLCSVLCAFLGHSTIAAPAHASESASLKVLFLGDGGHHKPSLRAQQVMPYLLQRGIEVVYTERLEDLSEENLSKYDALLIYGNRSELPKSQEQALLKYVKRGGGLVGIHSASACFTDSDAFIALLGGQFNRHGAGVFSTDAVSPDHPILAGLGSLESWDETYVHTRLNPDKTVLHVRRENGVEEPYTWIRREGRGRVFYTAWGHDERTWSNSVFHALVERGIRWAAEGDKGLARAGERVMPEFQYVEADNIPHYPQGGDRTGATKWKQMQRPLSAEESSRHAIVPGGFELALVADEPQIVKAVDLAFDERGRLWVAATLNYPNDVTTEGGQDKILIGNDENGDGRMDSFTTFADNLSLVTSVVPIEGGAIVLQPPQVLLLKDTDGDDRADHRQVLFEGFSIRDTHATASNLEYGLDNWIWGSIGYSEFDGVVGGEHHKFSMGIFRFKPDGSKLEVVAYTNNNTWGIGFNEEGLAFASTANANPSIYAGMPVRYYEQIKKGFKARRLSNIADSPRFLPVTEKIRQVDVHGGYTAAAGHTIYTARDYPAHYWNRAAFIAEPTGHLLGTFFLNQRGAQYTAANPNNLIASDDEWFAPVASAVGPDGAVWFIDWYNYIIQHNPTPAGFENGVGNAYETDLRDKTYGRIYRVVYGNDTRYRPRDLSGARSKVLVKTLRDDNMFWRLAAQRLLVERKQTDAVPALIKLVSDTRTDALGLNVGAMHALWTLHGLGAIDSSAAALKAATAALKHPSAGVRLNALQVLPANAATRDSILAANLLEDQDARVRMWALLALSQSPESDATGEAVAQMMLEETNITDPWIRDAMTVAAIRHAPGFAAAADRVQQQIGAQSSHGNNLLANASFEEMENSAPSGWHRGWQRGTSLTTVANVARSGKHSLEIRTNEQADAAWSQEVSVKPHTSYRLSGWIKTEGVNKGSGLGALLSVRELGRPDPDLAVAGTTDWTPFEQVFDSGTHRRLSISALFGHTGSSTGTVWFDDLELAEVSPAQLRLIQLDETKKLIALQSSAASVASHNDKDADLRVIELTVREGLMAFTQQTLTVSAGERVKLVFKNTDHMPHNVVFTAIGAEDKVGQLADEMAASPTGAAEQYVPKVSEVLFATPLVDPGESFELTITAPSTAGDYPYICTFPGHWRLMQGVLQVREGE